MESLKIRTFSLKGASQVFRILCNKSFLRRIKVVKQSKLRKSYELKSSNFEIRVVQAPLRYVKQEAITPCKIKIIVVTVAQT